MTTFQTLARSFAESFETATRDDGTTFYRLKDGSPGWMADAIRKSHDDELPDDWRYETCSDLAEQIAEYEDGSDACDAAYEMADTLTMVYTSDLFKWYGDNPSRLEYANGLKREWSAGNDDIRDLLAAGQAFCVNGMANALIHAIEAAADEQEDEE